MAFFKKQNLKHVDSNFFQMLNNLVKFSFLVLAICATILLFGIYLKLGANRYQISRSNGTLIIDTYTGEIYVPVPGGFKDYNKNDDLIIQKLP